MTERKPLRALVIDDSALSRQTITRMLEDSPLVEVVGWAADGKQALRQTLDLEPDVITLDLEMPGMDGYTFLRIVMARRPTPVIVVSGHDGQADVFKALELGAVDFVAKPKGFSEDEIASTRHELIRKVLGLRGVEIEKLRSRPEPPVARVPGVRRLRSDGSPIVVIGASTGGPTALSQIFSAFSGVPDCPILVAQHMPVGFTRGFAERLDRSSPFEVREASDGDRLESGRVLLAPGGHHLEVQGHGIGRHVRVSPDSEIGKNIPSVDRLFQTAAKELGENVIGIVLTGMGDDGLLGAREIRAAGGRIIAESEESAVIYGMPRRVIDAGWADEVLPLREIPGAIERIVVQEQGSAGKTRDVK